MTNETDGAFHGVRLVSSTPFTKDTQVTISFKDITATGMISMDTPEYEHIIVGAPYVVLLVLHYMLLPIAITPSTNFSSIYP